MSNDARTIQILFVVETNSYVRSDNAYIVWLLKKSFSKYIIPDIADELFIQYDFIYMDGKCNYSKRSIKTDIKFKTTLFSQLGNTYVVFCIDVDTISRDDKQLVDNILTFTKANNYHLILFYREIEDVVKAPGGGTKHERVKKFLNNYPKSCAIDSSCLCVPFENIIDHVGNTNFNTVIQDIISIELKRKMHE